MASPFEPRLTAILKTYVTPFLNDLGFRKDRNVYERVCGEWSWLIEIQRSHFQDKERADFTINCGIYIPAVAATYFEFLNGQPPKSPDEALCAVRVRLGRLASEFDRWWQLCAGDDTKIVDHRIGQELADLLKCHALPFFQRFKSLREIADFLVGPWKTNPLGGDPNNVIGPAYAGILFCKLGDRERAAAAFETCLRNHPKRLPSDRLRNLRDRVLGGDCPARGPAD